MSLFKNQATAVQVTAYVPQNLEAEAPETIKKFDFINRQEANSNANFIIDPQISSFIGLTEAKNKEDKKKFDAEVLKYIQKIKDGAFQEAYQKGLEQGIQEAQAAAFAEAQKQLDGKLTSIIEVLSSIGTSRQKIYETNEKEVVNFCYYMAEKIVNREIQRDPGVIVETIKKVTDSKEPMTVHLSVADYDFIAEAKERLTHEMQTAHITFEKDETLSAGDVIVKSEYGFVDATVRTRLQRLKQILDDQE